MRRALLGILGVAVGTALLVGVRGREPGPPTLSGMVSPLRSPLHLPPGTYAVAGPVEQTPHGLVQVRIRVVGGRLVDVVALALPEGGRSTEINGRAVPVLRREALAAQCAHIDAVSGATNTSRAYALSLQAALDAAVRGVRR
jgi:uncharacterized protein with FMN-binding domain